MRPGILARSTVARLNVRATKRGGRGEEEETEMSMDERPRKSLRRGLASRRPLSRA
jgi:hypothetical protein